MKSISITDSIKTKIIFPVIVTLVIISVCGIVLITHTRSEALSRQLQERVKPIANGIVNHTSITKDEAELQRFVSTSAAESDIELVLVVMEESSEIIASNRLSYIEKKVDDLALNSRIKDSLDEAKQSGQSIWSEFKENEYIIHYSVPVRTRIRSQNPLNYEEAVIIIRYNANRLFNINRSESIFQYSLFSILILLCGALLFILISRHVLSPLRKLTTVIHRRSIGDKNYVDYHKSDEFGLLSKSFNQMLDHIDDTEKRLNEKNYQLDLSVGELSLFRNAVNASSILVQTNVAGTIIDANENFSKISGYSKSELIGRNHRLIKSGAHDKSFFKDMYRTISSGKIWRGDICNKNKSGRTYWVDTTIVPVLKEDGKPIRYLALRFEITKQKKFEEDLVDSRIKAEKANKAKSFFLATMSHEIRTPLNAVIGMTSLLKDTPLNSEQKEFLDTIQQGGESLLHLINDILDLSKIEAEKVTPEESNFQLVELLERVMDLFKSKAFQKRIRLEYNYEQAIPLVLKGDIARIQQILINLIGNALKFTSEGGISVSVSAYKIKPKLWNFAFNVEDTGIGIKEESQKGLFEAFTQAEDSTTRVFGGTGLGLTICRKLARILDGDISFKSVYGEGSLFTLNLPIKCIADPVVASFANSAEPDSKTVHIIDCPKTTANFLINRLNEDGMSASSYSMSSDTVDRLIETAPDFVFLSSTSGIDLLRAFLDKLKALAPEQPTVFILDFSNTRMDEFLKEFGVIKFTIPFHFWDLHQHIVRAQKPQLEQNVIKQIHEPKRSLATSYPLDILVVEDNPANQQVILRTLESMGYSTKLAENGEECVSAFEAEHFDLIIMDIEMPIMNGLEATRMIRSAHKDPIRPYIIALTANIMNSKKEQCLNSGMNHYLSKPIQLEQLKSSIVSAFNIINPNN